MARFRLSDEKAVRDVLKAKGWPDTPANRVKARKLVRAAWHTEPGELYPRRVRQMRVRGALMRGEND